MLYHRYIIPGPLRWFWFVICEHMSVYYFVFLFFYMCCKASCMVVWQDRILIKTKEYAVSVQVEKI